MFLQNMESLRKTEPNNQMIILLMAWSLLRLVLYSHYWLRCVFLYCSWWFCVGHLT